MWRQSSCCRFGARSGSLCQNTRHKRSGSLNQNTRHEREDPRVACCDAGVPCRPFLVPDIQQVASKLPATLVQPAATQQCSAGSAAHTQPAKQSRSCSPLRHHHLQPEQALFVGRVWRPLHLHVQLCDAVSIGQPCADTCGVIVEPSREWLGQTSAIVGCGSLLTQVLAWKQTSKL